MISAFSHFINNAFSISNIFLGLPWKEAGDWAQNFKDLFAMSLKLKAIHAVKNNVTINYLTHLLIYQAIGQNFYASYLIFYKIMQYGRVWSE